MEPQFNFCYSKSKPETLVMLKNHKLVAELLFNSFMFVFIDGQYKKFKDLKFKLENILKVPFMLYESIQTAKIEISKNEDRSIIVLININLLAQGRDLKNLEEVKHLYFYCSDQKQRSQFYCNCNQLLSLQMDEWKQSIIVGEQQLINQLKQYKDGRDNKILPNFLFMATEICTSQTLVRTMHALLNQRIDQETADEINYNFLQLVQEIQNFEMRQNDQKTVQQAQIQKQLFFYSLKQGIQTKKDIIGWYTGQTFVYRIINKLFRAHRNPTEIFYIQPYVKKLFNTIHELYVMQSKKRKFMVYRGGVMKRSQFLKFEKNRGKTVQNLGFLSTSMSKYQAIYFKTKNKGNAIFEIEVEQVEGGLSEFGFADLKQFSKFKNQQEILFNPLNTFKVHQAQEVQPGQFCIFLKYLNLRNASLSSGSCKQVKQRKQEDWMVIARLQREEKYQNQCQGNALTNQYYHLKEGDQYWDKYLLICRQSNNNKWSDYRLDSAIADLRYAYAYWNKIYFSLMNKEYNLKSDQFQDFRPSFYELFISSKFSSRNKNIGRYFKLINSLKYEMNFCSNLITSSISLLSPPEVRKFEVQPECLFFQVITIDRTQHCQKLKPNITKIVDLSKRKLSDEAINSQQIKKIIHFQISQLNLGENNLTFVPSIIFGMCSLNKLYLEENKILNLPSELFELNQLCQLNLHNNCLEKVPKGFARLNQLRRLHLEHNLLQQLPEDIFNIQTLTHLDLSNNKIRYLPQDLSNLKEIKQIWLQNNQLVLLPDTICKLRTLEWLYLAANKLEELPKGIGELVELKNLSLSSNKIKNLREQILELRSLQRLHLDQNPLQLQSLQIVVMIPVLLSLSRSQFQKIENISCAATLVSDYRALKNIEE